MIGILIRSWRMHREIGVRETAKHIGVSPATVSRIESGKPVDGATMLKLLNFLFNEDRKETPSVPISELERVVDDFEGTAEPQAMHLISAITCVIDKYKGEG